MDDVRPPEKRRERESEREREARLRNDGSSIEYIWLLMADDCNDRTSSPAKLTQILQTEQIGTTNWSQQRPRESENLPEDKLTNLIDQKFGAKGIGGIRTP